MHYLRSKNDLFTTSSADVNHAPSRLDMTEKWKHIIFCSAVFFTWYTVSFNFYFLLLPNAQVDAASGEHILRNVEIWLSRFM